MQLFKYFTVIIAAMALSYCAPKVGDQVSVPSNTSPKVEKSDFRSMAPGAGPARKIEIGSYESFTLDNGLKVIVVENHKIPRISYQLFVDRDPTLEGELAGMTSIAGDLLSAGTTSRTKAQIDESVDFVGGSVSSNAQGGFATALTRHSETILAIFADIVLNPSFPEDEFEKLKKQLNSGLQTQKDDPDAISGNVSNVLLYGKDHPYGEIITEVTVNNITLDDCKAYYKKYFKPNISYLVIVGDITPGQSKSQAEKYFGSWKKGMVEDMTYEMPKSPEKAQVAFIDKAGAVQSVINVAYPVNLKPGGPDVIPARVTNTILGAGFSGRLFKNLREDKAYTYGAYSSLNADEVVGEFSATASVRNEVTDSAIIQFLYELNKMRTEEVTDSELELAKNFIAGTFARSLEGPETVATFALNTFRYGLPADYYETYLEKLEKVSKADVLAMAQKYIHPEKAHIVVVGNLDAVSDKIGVFDIEDGKVGFYDIYGNKKAPPSKASSDVSGKDVINAYLKAIGGEQKVRAVTSLSMDASMAVQGMGDMTVEVRQMAPNKMSMTMGMTGMTVMKQVFDGEKGYVEQMGQRQIMEGEMLKQLKQEAQIFAELTYLGPDYTLEVKGIEEINGESAYKLLVTGPAGTSTEYYGVDSGLKLKSIKTQGEGEQVQSVTTEYIDYREVSGVKIPHTTKIIGMAPIPLEMKASLIEINKKIDPSVFSVE